MSIQEYVKSVTAEIITAGNRRRATAYGAADCIGGAGGRGRQQMQIQAASAGSEEIKPMRCLPQGKARQRRSRTRGAVGGGGELATCGRVCSTRPVAPTAEADACS